MTSAWVKQLLTWLPAFGVGLLSAVADALVQYGQQAGTTIHAVDPVHGGLVAVLVVITTRLGQWLKARAEAWTARH